MRRPMHLKRRALQGTLLLLLVAVCGLPAAAQDECKTSPPQLKLLTGLESLYYYKVGEEIATVARNSAVDAKVEIVACPVSDTLRSIDKLECHDAEFALVQSDVAHAAWSGHPPEFSQTHDNVKLVLPLFIKAVHILVRPHLNIATVRDLRGRKVWLGPAGSGTEFTAKRVLDAAGLKTDKSNSDVWQFRCHNPEDAISDLQRMNLDAVFLVGVVPYDPVRGALVPRSDGQTHREQPATAKCEEAKGDQNTNTLTPYVCASKNSRLIPQEPKIERAPPYEDCENVQARRQAKTNQGEIRLLGLDYDLVDRLVRDGSYIEKLIGPDKYCQDQGTLTVGVEALLLTGKADNDADVSKLFSIINDNRKTIEKKLETTKLDLVGGVLPQLELERAFFR